MIASSGKPSRKNPERLPVGKWKPVGSCTKSLKKRVWALRGLGPESTEALALVPLISCLDSQDVSMLSWAMAACLVVNSVLLGSLAGQAVSRMTESSPLHIANTLWSCSARDMVSLESGMNHFHGEQIHKQFQRKSRSKRMGLAR